MQEVDEGAPEIWIELMKCPSPEEVFQSLNDDETSAVSRWKERRRILMQKRVQEEVEAEIETDLSLARESFPFLRLKVRSVCPESSTRKPEEALLTIWRPTEAQLSILKEGSAFQVQSLAVRQTHFDGLLQLTGNSNTIMQEFNKLKDFPRHWLEKQSQRRFLNMFEIHLLSRKAFADGSSAKSRFSDFDAVGAQVNFVHTAGNEKKVCMYISDEFNLILRIEFDKAFLKNPNLSAKNRFPVFAFRDLRLLPFDSDENCAVARFGGMSSYAKSSPRMDELMAWVSKNSEGHARLERLSLYLRERLPLFERTDNVSAFGHAVGLKCASNDKLHIEVDCGNSRVEEWELPVSLLKDVLPVVSQNQQVSLLLEEEQRLAAIGVLGKFFRAKGVLWHFELRSRSTPMPSSSPCNYVVSSIKKADTRMLGQLHDKLS